MPRYECPAINGMHIHYDVIVEIVDPQTGEVLPEDSPGEVVVTCNNKTYPLVRFGTGDISSIVTGQCSCGRTGPRLTRIMGRADQVTKVKGMFVHPSQVQKVMETHPEIAKARLLVERPQDQDIMTLEVELRGVPRRIYSICRTDPQRSDEAPRLRKNPGFWDIVSRP